MKDSGAYSILAVSVAALLTAIPALAIETTGAPGSPGSTTTISGKHLPPH